MVANPNASYLGGLSAAGVQLTGDGFTSSSIPFGPLGSATMVTSTGKLPAATYHVTATALMSLPGAEQRDLFRHDGFQSRSDTRNRRRFGRPAAGRGDGRRARDRRRHPAGIVRDQRQHLRVAPARRVEHVF
jgi:hypothetical protein